MARERKQARRGEALGKTRPEARDAEGTPAAAPAGVASGSTAPQAQARPQKQQARRRPARRKVGALSRLRSFAPVAVVVVCAAAFVANVPLGNISSFGWDAISAICPVGALSVLLASKALVPRALVSLALAAALILVFGRAFCSWACTVPLVQRTLGIRSASKQDARRDRRDRERRAAKRGRKAKGKAAAASEGAPAAEIPADVSPSPAVAPSPTAAAVSTAPAAGGSAARAALTDEERAQIKAEMHAVTGGGCGGRLFDSRHLILGGSLVAALAFGFPVFCLLCPIGLTFASVYLVLRVFTGQFSWAAVVVPVLLVAELLIFRRWCYRICPVSALLSLASRGNRTFVPALDATKCLVTAKGKPCGACSTVCPEGIDLHDYARGERGINECVKCRKCVDACPTRAITLPLVPPRDRWPHSSAYGPRVPGAPAEARRDARTVRAQVARPTADDMVDADAPSA